MPGPILYSTNPYFSVEVARKYRDGNFYAWCSEVFSAGQQAGDAPTSLVAASSDPRTVYEQLKRAVESEDEHDGRIEGYKKTFKRLASSWFASGEITEEQRDEIQALCKKPSWKLWRPLLYVVPRLPVESRLTLVKPHKRAGPGLEYTISDLKAAEFDIIELPWTR